MRSDDLQALLKEGATELDCHLSDEAVAALRAYLEELKKWNRKINLTAIRNDRDIIIKHFLDSLSYHKGFSAAAGSMLLDMGSGAGFPGLPLKIAFPAITVTLVESIGKKASFLRHMVRTLRIDGLEVRDVRTEDLPQTLEGRYDVVTARAFASIEQAWTAGQRFLKPEGVMVLSRGPEEGIDDRACEALGMIVASKLDLVLPRSDHRRSLWVLRKKA